jgi:hypothetical protein
MRAAPVALPDCFEEYVPYSDPLAVAEALPLSDSDLLTATDEDAECFADSTSEFEKLD